MSVRELLAIDTVHLPIAAATPKSLRHFYIHILGLELFAASPSSLTFRHGLRRVILTSSPPAESLNRLTLLVTSFSTVLKNLSTHAIPHDLLHIDAGLSRLAILQDPANNTIHLLETRPL